MGDKPEFLFVDESGDPGDPDKEGANQVYILSGIRMSDTALKAVSQHMVSFRYHHGITSELKNWGVLLKDKFTPQARVLLGYLADLTEQGEILSLSYWVDKDDYSGPHPPGEDDKKFRHFQLRLFLEGHRSRRKWGTNLDLVLDRWSMSDEDKANLEEYLKGNWNLRPEIRHITVVDSLYSDPVQIADLYTRLVRKVVENKADEEQQEMCKRLMEVRQLKKGIF